MLDIKNIEGKVVFSTPINKGCKRKYTLMQEDYISLVFSVAEPIYFRLGDSIYDCQFEITDLVSPKYNNATAGYDYEVKFDKYYWKWKNKKFFYTEQAREASWSLTANLYTQLSIVIKNLEFLNYRYKGKAFEFSVDSTVEKISKPLRYDNLNIIEALNLMAQTWECEWWVTDNIIHFGRCEYGTAVDFKLNDNVEKMSKSEGKQTFATRIYAFGSERNIPKNYRPTDSMTVNGVVQKRLMLPVGTSYIDAYEGMTNEEAVEQVVIFDEVYPKLISEVSKVESKEGKDEVGKIWTYFISDDSLKFDKKYILPDTELRLVFQSGKLNGLDFALSFANNKFEIIRNEDYGRLLPDDILKPEIGDEFILHGYDTEFVSDALLPKAEQELKERAIEFVEKSKIDPSTYECSMMSDYMLNGGNPRTFEVGDRVRLINKAYFKDSRISRIIGYEYPLDMPYDSPIYIVGETASYSHLEEIKAEVKELTYKEKTFSGSGSNVYVIGQHDSTPPTDRNVLSSQKSLNSFHRKDQTDSTDYLQKFNKGAEFGDYKNKKGAYINEEGKADFNEVQSNKVTTKDLVATNTKTTNLEADVSTLEKSTINDLVAQLAKVHSLTVEDTAKILKAVVGSVSSEQFKSGFLGEGFRIYEALNGDWNLEIDNVIVRKVFSVFELIIQKITHQGGMVIHSPNGAKITKVTDGGSYWKCEHDSATDFFKDDQILCQNFTGNNIKRYWRLATSTGKGYLNLSKTDQEANSAIPQEGDEIVVLGNRTNINRQSAIIVSTIGDNAPYTAYLSNINSYSLVGKETTRIGNLNGIVDKDFGALKGNGLFSENVYLKGIFRLTNGKTIEKVIEDSSNSLTNSIQATKSELNASISKAEQTALLAQKSVDELEIGGRNLLTNNTGDFKNNITEPWLWSRATGEYTLSTHNGLLRLDHGSATGWSFISRLLGYTLLSNRDYTLVLRMKSSVAYSNLNIRISYANGTNNVFSSNNLTFEKNEMKTLEFSFKARDLESIDQTKLYIQIQAPLAESVQEIEYIMLEEGNKPSLSWTPAPEDQQAELKKEITSVRTDFQITETQINGKLQETTQILTESKALSGETKQTLEATTARINEFDITAKKFEGTIGEITKKQGEVEGSILNVQATANSLQASITGFKETEREIKETATRIEATHQGIVLEASEKSAQKAIDGIEIGDRNFVLNSSRTITGNGYPLVTYSLSKECNLKSRDYVQVIIYGELSEARTSFGIWNTTGNQGPMFFITHNDYNERTKRYEKIAKWNVALGDNSTVIVYPQPGNSGSINVINKISIKRGTKITDWSPAPEDIQSQFTEASASLKVLNDQIASEVSKTNGIRTDLTTLSQSHNSFKAQVKSDISGAIDSNNEVIRSSFEMKDNVITMIGKRVNVLAELKVGSNTLIKDGFINTDLLRVKSITADKIDVNSIFATRIQTGNLDVTAGATIGGFELGNGRIGVSGKVWDSNMNNGNGGYRPAEPGESSGGTDFGNLTIYKDFFKVGGKNGYVMFGDDVIPSTVGGAFNAVGRITNKRQNKGSDFSYDRANYGLFIEVDGGTKNYGLHSNAALIAPSFIGTSVGELDFNGSTYNIDFSQHSIFIMNRSLRGGVTITMPPESSVARHFGQFSLKNGFGFIFTVVAKTGTERIVLENIRNANHNLTNFAFGGGDSATILAHKTGGIFEYQMLTHNT